MNGVLVIDKPAGMTSFDVIRRVRRMVKTRRVGHAGTLDPMATGVLPVAVGTATRLIEYLMAGDKTYRAGLKLGSVTDTQYSTVHIHEKNPWKTVDRTAIEYTIEHHHGEKDQLTPKYSSMKKEKQTI